MVHFVGIDAGASNLRLRIENAAGDVVGESWGRPASLTQGAERAAASIRDAIIQALFGTNLTIDQCAIGCGIAGCRQEALKRRVCNLLADAASITLISDGYAALLGAHGGKPGAIVVVGTGSVGLSLDDQGKIRQVGGWGPLGGDEGSGCWIGREAVRACLRCRDDGRPCSTADTNFFVEIHEALGGEHNAILDWLRLATPTTLAALAPAVLDHAASGSEEAEKIIDRATAELERLVRLVGENGKLLTALDGGLAWPLKGGLPAEVSKWVTLPAADAISGALQVARGLAPPENYGDID
ncbi:MAG: BadF/BadG/BcrA/BcrD ATPase family protein [Geminicoccaceae bacterium]